MKKMSNAKTKSVKGGATVAKKASDGTKLTKTEKAKIMEAVNLLGGLVKDIKTNGKPAKK